MTAVYMRNFEPLDDGIVARQKRSRLTVIDGTNFPIEGRAFPVADLRYAFYYGYLPDYVSTPTVDLLWTQTGAPSGGSINWQSFCAAITPGDTTRFSDKAFAATADSTSTSVLADQLLQKTTITLTNNDSLAAGDLLIVRINRNASNVTCGGTAVLIAVSINYTGT